MTLIEHAPAKLNLALHVRGRRADGYHDLETLFAFADDGDVLEGAPAESLELTVDGPMAAGLSAGEDNLVLRAARLLQDAAGVSAGATLRLTKNLPVASGIGGGSADAAAALKLLNRLWEVGWPLDRLAELATGLGADVPACVHSCAMIGRGVGERLTPVGLGALAGAPVLLVNPMRALATGPVFAAWDGTDRGALGDDLSLSGLGRARNDLQPGAIAMCPDIAAVLEALSASPGTGLVRMSGSGATCFAIFVAGAARDDARRALAAGRPDWWFLSTALRAET